jgi:dihydroneopterin aldolase
MSDKIIIKGISAKGFHGASKSERKNGQKFIVDIELILDLKKLQDNLGKTVNYAEVTEIVVKHVMGEPFLLIETLAEKIAKNLLDQFNLLDSVYVTIHKPKAPIPFKFKDVLVQIQLQR